MNRRDFLKGAIATTGAIAGVDLAVGEPISEPSGLGALEGPYHSEDAQRVYNSWLSATLERVAPLEVEAV